MDIEVVESFSQTCGFQIIEGKIMLEIHKGQDLDILVRKFEKKMHING